MSVIPPPVGPERCIINSYSLLPVGPERVVNTVIPSSRGS